MSVRKGFFFKNSLSAYCKTIIFSCHFKWITILPFNGRIDVSGCWGKGTRKGPAIIITSRLRLRAWQKPWAVTGQLSLPWRFWILSIEIKRAGNCRVNTRDPAWTLGKELTGARKREVKGRGSREITCEEERKPGKTESGTSRQDSIFLPQKMQNRIKVYQKPANVHYLWIFLL